MSNSSGPVSHEEFEQQVRDCLAHLYDYTFLQDHPLVVRAVPNHVAANRVQAFRQLILETIEQLRPDAEVALLSRQARSYNILTLRYVEDQPTNDVMQQLALSARQFYREHRKALKAMGSMLWGRLVSAAADPRPEAEPAFTVQSEVQRVQTQTQVDVQSLLQGALEATQELVEQHGIAVAVDAPGTPPVIETNRAVLRQTILWMLSQLIVHCTGGETLRLSWNVNGQHCMIKIGIEGWRGSGDQIDAGFVQHETLAHLIEALEGRLDFELDPGGALRLALSLPLDVRTILVIDDNPDVVNLFNRYLAGQVYHTVGASDGKAAIQLARDLQPRLIILDVMLPGPDGWEVLQHLKNHPATRHVPVVVCSVLETPDLAFSLGADGYMKKPPGRLDFLNALARWLD